MVSMVSMVFKAQKLRELCAAAKSKIAWLSGFAIWMLDNGKIIYSYGPYGYMLKKPQV